MLFVEKINGTTGKKRVVKKNETVLVYMWEGKYVVKICMGCMGITKKFDTKESAVAYAEQLGAEGRPVKYKF